MKNVISIFRDFAKEAFKPTTIKEVARPNNALIENAILFRSHSSPLKESGLTYRSNSFDLPIHGLVEYVSNNTGRLYYGACSSIKDLETGYLGGRSFTNTKKGLMILIADEAVVLNNISHEIMSCRNDDSHFNLGDNLLRENEVIFCGAKTEKILVSVQPEDYCELIKGNYVKNAAYEFNKNAPEFVSLSQIHNYEFLVKLSKQSLQDLKENHEQKPPEDIFCKEEQTRIDDIHGYSRQKS
ncbi:hypothetical protein L3V86_08040 [Thiotrichales bacterium 19S11-10]|nr:hypothetical protein [Thiotrichales bacterium 19S11-10]